VIDGLSSSRHSSYAVGKFGKGFLLAIQWIFEQSLKLARVPAQGCSFRVGHHVGLLQHELEKAPMRVLGGNPETEEEPEDGPDVQQQSPVNEGCSPATNVRIWADSVGRECFKGNGRSEATPKSTSHSEQAVNIVPMGRMASLRH
jgi:hypothetical protein